MKKIIKFNLIALLAMVFFVSSCDDEDNTGYSELTKTNPTITVSGIQDGGYSLIEADTTYKFDVTLSEAQISDISVYVTQTDGDAILGEDFEIVNTNNRIYFPASKTTATLEIKILNDDLSEGVESFTLTIGDERTANATINPVTVTYTLGNYAADDLNIELAWDIEVYDQYGDAIDATDVADMILTIYDADGVMITQADGASFEEAVLEATEADGSYYVVASFFAVEQYPDAVGVDLTLDFSQVGVLEKTISNSGVLQTNQCGIYFQLAEIVKLGTTYTINEDIFYELAFENAEFVGSYGGDDGNDAFYAAAVNIAEVGTDLTIEGLCNEWMEDYWGETVTEQVPVIITLDNEGNFVIEEQYLMTTDWNGSPYVYNIIGEGTYSLCDYSLSIVYELYNVTDDYNVAETYMGAYFTADIALGAKSKIEIGKSYRVNVDIPVRVR